MKRASVMFAVMACFVYVGCNQQEPIGKTVSAQEEKTTVTETTAPVQPAAKTESGSLLIDDFEGVISGGPEGTVDYGSGNNAVVEVSAAGDIKQSGEQSLKVTFDSPAESHMWIARGFGLDAKNAAWLKDAAAIDWAQYNAFSFYMYGSDSKAQVAFDIKDSGNEIWRFLTTDDFTGWKQIICPFSAFSVRGDWQPDNADKNGTIDFPVKSYQFEPRPVSKGTLYFDKVELIKQD